jgi:hypothetical protein
MGLLEIVSPRGRRQCIASEHIVLVTENDDVTGPPGLLVNGLPMVQAVVGETYEGLSERVLLARATEAVVPSPVPVVNEHGMRVLPDGTADRGAMGARLVT